MRSLVPCFIAGFVVLASCGGKVVYVEEGGGGSSVATGSSSSITSGTQGAATASTGTGTNDCAALKAALDAAVASAQACGPQLAVVQCDGSQIMNDECGCPSILLNEKNPQAVAAAKTAMTKWIQAECGPFQCGGNCVVASAGFCQPTSDATGKCAVALPD